MTIFRDKIGRPLGFAKALPKIINRLYNYLLDFELMVLRWVGHIPFHTVRKIIYKLAGLKIGTGSTIHMWANFFQPKNIEIGEDTTIGNNSFLDGRNLLKIGSHVDLASEVMIYNSEHDLESSSFEAKTAPVEIGDYVFVGPRAIILPGVRISRGAVVAAGAVVTKNIGEFEIVGGVPAKTIGERKQKDLNYKLGRARLFQ